jgi:hypothetical protein
MACARITRRAWLRSRWGNGSAKGVLGIEANGGGLLACDIHLANVVTGAVEHHENLIALYVACVSCVTPLPPMNGAQKSQKHHPGVAHNAGDCERGGVERARKLQDVDTHAGDYKGKQTMRWLCHCG